MDVQTIRTKVFQMYGLPEPSPKNPSHKILQKAHYTFMIDRDFMQEVRQVKQSHEHYMTAILASDVFPMLDVKNPLESLEDDSIPDRFGPKWYEYERDQARQTRQDEEEIKSDRNEEDQQNKEMKFSQIVIEKDTEQIADLDSHIDQQKRLLFTETRMKAVNDGSQFIGELDEDYV